MSLPHAHETWFVDHPEDYPVHLSDLTRPAVLAGLALAVALTWAWREAARRLPVPELRALSPLTRYAVWAPRLLAIHLGASLLLLASQRTVLDPGVSVPHGIGGTLLLVPEISAGLLMLAGRWV